MATIIHERPGVYSSYDASAVIRSGRSVRVIGVAAKSVSGTVNTPVTLTSYEAGVSAFGEDAEGSPGMSTILRLLFLNSAATVVAVAVDEDDYAAALAALETAENVQVVVCDSADQAVQQKLRESVENAAALRRERDEWKAKAEALEPDASAYGILKERTAGVELEAHRRAQTVLDQADAQATELRRNMEQWMDRVEREYDALRSEVEATVSHAADKLEKAGKCLQQVSELLADQDMALEALSQAYDGTAPDKVPAPVPLNED